MIGIYKITSPSGRIYIGQSINIDRRYKSYSRVRCEKQVRIYHSINKYGWDSHVFEVVEECLAEDLNTKERWWQDFHNCIGKDGLNCFLTETSKLPKVYSKEMKEKMSEAQKARVYSEESIKKMSESAKGNKNMLGKKHSEETKRVLSDKAKGFKHTEESKIKISEAGKGRVFNEEIRNKISESNKGKVFSKERRLKISIALSGRKIPEDVVRKRSVKISRGSNYKAKLIINLDTGIYYDCVQDACDSANMNRSTLNNYLCGNRKNKTSFVYA